MKIFATGAAGFIGSVTVKELLNRGHQVLVFDDLSTGHRQAVDSRAEFYCGELGDPNHILPAMRTFQPDAVMHFASLALVGESMEYPLKYFRNVSNGIALLDAMQWSGCDRIVFSSSCAIFGNAENGMPIAEDHPKNPINPYGESKLMFEKVLNWLAERKGLRQCSLRYFNAAGATECFGEDHDPETHLIPNVLTAASGKRSHVEIYGKGDCVRDYIHVLDLADAHVMALESGVEGGFNLGTGKGSSVNDVIASVIRVTGKHPVIKKMPARAGDPPTLVANPALFGRRLGWKATRDLDEMVRSAWDWSLRNPNGYGRC